MTELLLLPDCVLPGCHNPVETIGHPCTDCRNTFGAMIEHNPDGEPITAEQIERRDGEARRAYLAMAVTALPPIPDDDVDMGNLGERKRNQTCWMCDERRTCTWGSMGWECDTCREIES